VLPDLQRRRDETVRPWPATPRRQSVGDRVETIEVHGLPAFQARPSPLPPATGSTAAVAQRRLRVALLVEEEGLERGARTRIAGWLGVSLSTIGRDITALLAAGDPIVTNALMRANRHRMGTVG
jgi:hypothetical protein